MRFSHFALVAASIVMAACGSDGSTAPGSPALDTRLTAVIAAPAVPMTGPMFTLRVDVTSALTEVVTSSSCVDIIEARSASGTTWTNVSVSPSVCNANILRLQPGQTVSLNAAVDLVKVRALSGVSASAVFRVRNTFTGANGSYTVQTAEATLVVPN